MDTELRDVTRGPVAENLAAIVECIGADTGTVHWLEPDGLLHLLAATPGLPDQVIATIQTIPVGKGMAGLAVERQEPVTTCNIQSDTSGDVRPGARATSLGGAVVVPIFDGTRVAGALGVANWAERTFSTDDVRLLIAAGRQFAADTLRAELTRGSMRSNSASTSAR